MSKVLLVLCLVCFFALPLFAQSVDTTRANLSKEKFTPNSWVCGDANGDGHPSIADVIYTINYLMGLYGGIPPNPLSAANVDGICGVNVADPPYQTSYQFTCGVSFLNCMDPVPCTPPSVPGNSITIGCSPCPYYIYPDSDSIAIPIYISNSVPLAGFTVGFTYNSDSIEITSIDTSGSVLPYGLPLVPIWTNFNTTSNQVLIGWFWSCNPLAPQSGGLLTKLNAKIVAGTSIPGHIYLDSTSIGPAEFLFARDPESGGGVIRPDFFNCAFSPEHNGWQFSNTVENTWPESWWQQFNYNEAPYPEDCRNIAGAVFPDWPLFMSTTGKSFCYWDPDSMSIFRHSALEYWKALIGPWTGSSYGFAASAAAYYNNCVAFAAHHPEYNEIHEVPLTDETREEINGNNIAQFCTDQILSVNNLLLSKGHITTFNEVGSMLRRGEEKVLVIWGKDTSGKIYTHAVVPYRVEVDPYAGMQGRIYIYDPNCPAEFPYSETTYIKVDIDPDPIEMNIGWQYEECDWGGWVNGFRNSINEQYLGLFLMDPIIGCTPIPNYGKLSLSDEKLITQNTPELSQYVQFYLRSLDNVKFESVLGNIGQIGDSLYSTLSDGIPIIPISGYQTRPLGYFLPNSAWTAQLSGMTDSVFRFSLYTNSSVMVYSRDSVVNSDVEKIHYAGNDSTLWLHNPDTLTKSYGFKAITSSPDSEVICGIQNISISPYDSARYSITSGAGLEVSNFGGSKTYNLAVEIAGVNGDTFFYHAAINLDSNCSHKIVPDWRQHGDSAMILVDPGMTGVFDETLLVKNEYKPPYLSGDANGDGKLNVTDVIYLINYLFKGGPLPNPVRAADANCDAKINVTDVIYLINYLFKGGPRPAC